MSPICPRCGSVDVHSSRAKGPLEGLARVLGLPPRRCSACGWRGFRPRPLFPSKHGSQPELRAAEAPPPAPEPAPIAAPPPPADDRHSKRRKHKHRNHIKGKGSDAWKVALLAIALGIALGYVVYGMSN